MVKANPTVLKETAYIATWTGILSLAMQAVFLLTGNWNVSVLLGNLWGAAIMILNFFFMGLSVQKAVEVEEAEAKSIMKTSQTLRTFFIFVTVVIGVVVPWLSTLAVIISLFFPRIAIALRPLMKEKPKTQEVQNPNEAE